jgi:ribonuclease HI
VIIPVVKPGKEGSTEAAKYRPLSLLNVGGRVLEKLLIDRINHHIHSHRLLNGNHYGFIAQKSTVEAAVAVKGFAKENLQKRNYVIMVSLDVPGAFDVAWWPSILSNLRDLRCPNNLYMLTENYFSDGVAVYYANTYKAERKVSMGWLQGPCCGPRLWNVLYKALLNLDFSNHTKLIAFAHDLAIMSQGKTPTEAEAYANSDLARIEKWAKENKLSFNETKSKAMLISRYRKNDIINVYLNNRRLNQVTKMKYLEMYFDCLLTFERHIENIVERSTTMIYTLGKSVKLYWDLGHKSLKIIYEGTLIPILTYGAPVWEEAAGKYRNLSKLQRVRRLMNIKIDNAYRTISYDASCLMAGVPPITIVIAEKAQLYKTKLYTEGAASERDMPVPVADWTLPARRANIMETNDSISYATEIYTDGSKIGGKVGAGVAIYTDKTLVRQCRYKPHDCSSNNQAEQIAILKSLELLPTLDGHNSRTVAIYTDSKVTLAALKNNSIHNYLIEGIRNVVSHLTLLDRAIHFRWVKAHAGLVGNEMADTIAKEAAQDED